MIKDKKYMTMKNKRTSIILLLWVNCFLILDVITTIFLLNNGGQEMNTFLIYLTTITGLTLPLIVILTHIIAMLINIGSIFYIKHKDKLEMSILYMTRGVFIIYLLVVINNCIGIVVRVLL